MGEFWSDPDIQCTWAHHLSLLTHKTAHETFEDPSSASFTRKNFCDSGAEGRLTYFSGALQHDHHVV
jgi:hypothetical protein